MSLRKLHQFKQEDLVFLLCLAEGCDEKVGMGGTQRSMRGHASTRDADFETALSPVCFTLQAHAKQKINSAPKA